MVVLEVPARLHEKAVEYLQTHHRSAWAVVDIRPGSRWRVHRDSWERIEALWRAEDLLRAIREGLSKDTKRR